LICLCQMNEKIVLVNQSGQPIGSAPKLSSHNAHTPLHLAFSCYIFNLQGLLLLTKRAETKKVWPGMWTNSVCGHPEPEEAIVDALRRRCLFELGIHDIRDIEVLLPDYRYKTPAFNGIIENEVCPVYIATAFQEPKLNSEEVDEYKWINWDEVLEDVISRPNRYTYWFKDQLPKVKNLKALNLRINRH
jgi:isopentenyl-diphosphate delta-isomerase